MQTLEQYISEKYNNNIYWFTKEVHQSEQINRTAKVLDEKDFLNGIHNVLSRPDITWKNETFHTRKTIFQTVKSFIEFYNDMLVGKPISLSGNDEKMIKQYTNVYRTGNYNKVNYKLSDNLFKYGVSYEYVYYDSKTKSPKSRFIAGEDGYPIYSEDTNEYIGFIEYWTSDSNKVSYYNVYTGDKVYTYNNYNSNIHLTGEYTSYGLPIVAEIVDTYTSNIISLADDIKPILNEYEQFMSKLGDSIETNSINPILTQTGSMLQVPKGMDVNTNGFVIHLDDGAKMEYVTANIDTQTVQLYLNQLLQQMCDIACVPSVLYGQGDIANISETTIKLLYGKAQAKATKYKYVIADAIKQRNEIIRTILHKRGFNFENDSYIETIFNYNIPMSDTDLINNLSTQFADGCIDKQSYIEKSPLVNDSQQVLIRLRDEQGNSDSKKVEE